MLLIQSLSSVSFNARQWRAAWAQICNVFCRIVFSWKGYCSKPKECSLGSIVVDIEGSAHDRIIQEVDVPLKRTIQFSNSVN